MRESTHSHTQPTMGDAEAGGALPSQVVVESVDDAEEQPVDANREEPAGNTAIEGAAPVGEPLGDAANEDGEGLDVTKTNSEIGVEQGHGDKADGEDTTVEGGVEVADDGVENDMYRHVRQLALEAINAVRCRVVLSKTVGTTYPRSHLGLRLDAAGGLFFLEEHVFADHKQYVWSSC